jgi:DNA-binding MarR family transcriptional regulator
MQTSLEKSYLTLIEFLLLSKKSITEVGEQSKITSIQAITLLLLHKPRPMNNLTRIFNCDASNTTGIIDGLENKDLVGRFDQPGDRRVKMIKITEKGNKVRQTIINKLTGNDSYIIKGLSTAEVKTFISLIEKINSQALI